MNTYDYYAVAKDLARKLKDHSLPQWQERLENALGRGSTGGEILMALRWNLKELEREQPHLPSDLKIVVQELIQKIDETGW